MGKEIGILADPTLARAMKHKVNFVILKYFDLLPLQQVKIYSLVKSSEKTENATAGESLFMLILLNENEFTAYVDSQPPDKEAQTINYYPFEVMYIWAYFFEHLKLSESGSLSIEPIT